MQHNNSIRAELNAGAVRIALIILDYAYNSIIAGSDADWLDAVLEVEAPEVVARRRCLVLAGALPPLQRALRGLKNEEQCVFENTEHDFRLAFRSVVGGVEIEATIWLSSGVDGRVVAAVTTPVDTIADFIAGLDDIITVYPPRASRAGRDP